MRTFKGTIIKLLKIIQPQILFNNSLLFYKFPILRDRLVLCHFNHRLRGQDSELDQKFVKDIGKLLGIPLTSEVQNSYLKKE